MNGVTIPTGTLLDHQKKKLETRQMVCTHNEIDLRKMYISETEDL